MKPDQERVKTLLMDTITLLCKNGLNFHKELTIQGVVGITADDDVFVVHINETFLETNDKKKVIGGEAMTPSLEPPRLIDTIGGPLRLPSKKRKRTSVCSVNNPHPSQEMPSASVSKWTDPDPSDMVNSRIPVVSQDHEIKTEIEDDDTDVMFVGSENINRSDDGAASGKKSKSCGEEGVSASETDWPVGIDNITKLDSSTPCSARKNATRQQFVRSRSLSTSANVVEVKTEQYYDLTSGPDAGNAGTSTAITPFGGYGEWNCLPPNSETMAWSRSEDDFKWVADQSNQDDGEDDVVGLSFLF